MAWLFALAAGTAHSEFVFFFWILDCHTHITSLGLGIDKRLQFHLAFVGGYYFFWLPASIALYDLIYYLPANALNMEMDLSASRYWLTVAILINF